MEKDKNPNHKEEVAFKATEGKEFLSYVKSLETQDVNEDFLSLKNSLLYFKNKGKIDDVGTLSDEPLFLNFVYELEKSDVLENGLDFCIICDVSESIYPWRIYQKKSIYYALKDIENYIFSAEGLTPEHLAKIRIALVKYSDKDKGVEIQDFIEYKDLGDICAKIDSIDVKSNSLKKRNVFEALKSVSELKWNDDSRRLILHYCGDPQYGSKYTVNPKKMPEDYDPLPDGDNDIVEDDLFDSLSNLNFTKYNLVKFNDRCERMIKELTSKFDIDANKPSVDELK
jgi:hypothetical protein